MSTCPVGDPALAMGSGHPFLMDGDGPLALMPLPFLGHRGEHRSCKPHLVSVSSLACKGTSLASRPTPLHALDCPDSHPIISSSSPHPLLQLLGRHSPSPNPTHASIPRYKFPTTSTRTGPAGISAAVRVILGILASFRMSSLISRTPTCGFALCHLIPQRRT